MKQKVGKPVAMIPIRNRCTECGHEGQMFIDKFILLEVLANGIKQMTKTDFDELSNSLDHPHDK